MKQKILTYSTVILLGLAIAGPALAAIVLPTNPVGGGGPVLTGSGIVGIIQQIFNYFVTIGTILAVAWFIYGGIQYALGKPDGAKTMKNAAIGILAILGVGLVVNSIAALINRGLNVG
jgi:hypothetical protein